MKTKREICEELKALLQERKQPPEAAKKAYDRPAYQIKLMVRGGKR